MRNPFKRSAKRSRVILKGILTDVEVELISLLFDEMQPCNQKGYVAKAEDIEFKNIGSSAKVIVEKSEAEGRIYVTVMEPGTVDPEGDSYTAEEVVKACESFAKKGMIRKNDVNHNMSPVEEFYISQSYILKATDKAHYPDSKLGSWVAVIKCENLESELWKKVEAGKFNGVSIFGKAVDNGAASETAAGDAAEPSAEELAELTAKIEQLSEQEQVQEAQIKDLTEEMENLQKKARSSEQKEQFSSISKAIEKLGETVNKGINRQLLGEPDGRGQSMEQDIIKTLPDGRKLIVKADRMELYKALADIYSGDKMGWLTPSQQQLFLNAIIEPSGSFLDDLSILPITKAGTVDTGLLSDLIFYNHSDNQVLQSASTGNLSMGAQSLHSALTLSKATLEYYKDALGTEEAYGAYIESALREKIRQALEEIVFAGKRSANAGTNVAAMDGLIEKWSDNSDIIDVTVDDTTTPDAITMFTGILANFAAGTIASPNFRFYVSNTLYLNLLKTYMQRETGAGDGFLLNGGNLTFLGKQIKVAPMQSDIYVCAGNSTMCVLGYINDVELKIEHSGATFDYTIYTRSNWGVNAVEGKFEVFKLVTT